MRQKPIASAVLTALLFALGAGLGRARTAAKTPGLADLVLGPARVAYTGRLRFSHWNGVQRVVDDAQIYFDPPDRYLEEFYGADGKTARLVVSDGERDQVFIRRSGRLVAKSVAMSRSPAPDPARRWRLLISNYSVRLAGRRRVVGRSAWVVELRPKVSGKPWQTLLIDRETGIVLLNRRYLPGTENSSTLSFSAFALRKHSDPSIFRVEASLPPAGAAPLPLKRQGSSDALAFAKGGFPALLPGGFVLQAESGFRVENRSWVRQARYSDGLAFLSVFQTDRPVAEPGSTTGRPEAPISAALDDPSLLSFATTLQLSRAHRYYLLVGDVSPKLLRTVGKALVD